MPILFLKLGGSLITDKKQPHTPRMDVIARLAAEISSGLQSNPDIRLLIGHGSGSFGHVAANRYQTLSGVTSADDWKGFSEVWREARTLHNIMLDELIKAGLPVISFPPSAGVQTADRKITHWDLKPIQAALAQKLVPVVYGDVIFDSIRGGTILSTEELFHYLVPYLHPTRILLAGIEEGIWSDYPQRNQLIHIFHPEDLEQFTGIINGSDAIDVTGGMLTKVQQMLDLTLKEPGIEIAIFTGMRPGILSAALRGDNPGTLIRAVG